MDDVHISTYIIILILLLALSAFFSSSETALTTVNHIRIEILAKGEGGIARRAKRVLKVTDDKSKMLSAILICNNLVNILASAIATVIAVDFFGSKGVGIATGLLTLLVLIFGEITPKSMATLSATRFSLFSGGIILAIMYVLTPVIIVLNGIVGLIMKLFPGLEQAEDDGMTSEELISVVSESHEKGAIEEDEKEYIVNVFDFSQAYVREVMTPRIDMTLIRSDASLDEVMEIFAENMYTRYPVCAEDNSEEIIGIINIKEVFLHEKTKEFRVKDFLREAFLTFETKNTAELFDEMRIGSIAMALVLDEYGAFVGLVTLEDLLEELVGEIRDEFDTDEVDDITKLSEREYDVLGGANLDDVCHDLPLNFSSDDYDTIGGYLTGLFSHFPKTGETFVTEDGISLRVIAVKKSRIEKIRIRFPKPISEY